MTTVTAVEAMGFLSTTSLRNRSSSSRSALPTAVAVRFIVAVANGWPVADSRMRFAASAGTSAIVISIA